MIPTSRGALRLAVAGFLCTQLASAQTDPDKTAARSAAKAGQEAYTEGDYEKAIRLFNKAESLVHAPTHLLFIARAHEKMGRLVLAQETYRELIYEQLPENAPKAFENAQTAGREELAALEPRLPMITLTLEGKQVDDFSMIVDQNERPGLADVPQPIDPGKHTLSLRAPGAVSDEVTVSLEEGESKEITLVMRDAPSDAAAKEQQPRATAATEPHTEDSWSTTRTIGWVSVGVGGLGILAGTGLMVASAGNRGKANSICDGGICPISERSRVERLDQAANDFRTGSFIGLGVGVVTAGVGVALLVLSGKRSSSAVVEVPTFQWGTLAVTPTISPNGTGIVGRF